MQLKQRFAVGFFCLFPCVFFFLRSLYCQEELPVLIFQSQGKIVGKDQRTVLQHLIYEDRAWETGAQFNTLPSLMQPCRVCLSFPKHHSSKQLIGELSAAAFWCHRGNHEKRKTVKTKQTTEKCSDTTIIETVV